MNTDIRLSVTFFDHPKTVRLERRLGLEGIKSLLTLWMWTAINKPDGSLTNVQRPFDDDDVEISARWNGEKNVFTTTLIELGWLEKIDGGYRLHGWSERNSWAANFDRRGNKARFSRLANVMPEAFKILKGQGVTAISRQEYDAIINGSLTNVQRTSNNCLTPAPAPAPKKKEYSCQKPETFDASKPLKNANGNGTSSIPYKEILETWRATLPELPQPEKLTDERRAKLSSRWKADKDRQSVDWWEKLFQFVHGSPFLMGQKSDFRATLDFVIHSETRLQKIIEGAYH